MLLKNNVKQFIRMRGDKIVLFNNLRVPICYKYNFKYFNLHKNTKTYSKIADEVHKKLTSKNCAVGTECQYKVLHVCKDKKIDVIRIIFEM